MTTRAAVPAPATAEQDVFRSFLRYQVPRLIATTRAAHDGLTEDDAVEAAATSTRTAASTSASTHTRAAKASPIPVARLAAAKDAAREAFLAAHNSRPEQTAHADTAAHAASRKDPAHRLPTPPSGTGKRAARVGASTHSRSSAATATTTTTTTTTTSMGKAPSAEQVLQSVMANVRDTAPLLNAMFPPAPVTLTDVPSSSSVPITTSSSSTKANTASTGADQGQWVCFVSTEPATREEVARMHAQLRQRLPERRARASGICPVRREIYEDVFDELLRQIAVEEPARGVLLQRLRDDLRDSLRVHQDLCNRSQLLCATRCLQAHDDETLAKMEAHVKEMEGERNALRATQHALMVRRAAIEASFEKARTARNKKQQDELAYLRRANQQLSVRLKLETERVTANVNNNNASRLDALTAAAAE